MIACFAAARRLGILFLTQMGNVCRPRTYSVKITGLFGKARVRGLGDRRKDARQI